MRCLEFVQESSSGREFVYAVPVTRSGTPIAPRYPVAAGALLTACANGDRFLVAMQNTVYLLDGATGDVVTSATISTSTAGPIAHVAGTGSTWGVLLYTSEYQTSIPRLILLDGNTLVKVTETSITNMTAYGSIYGMIGGPNQYLVWTKGKAWRLDATTGALLDASTPIVISKYKTGITSIASVNDHYQIIWRTSADIYSARLGTDGVMIDADDEFNQVTGGRVLCTGCASDNWNADLGTYGVFATYDGTTLNAEWAYGSSSDNTWYLAHPILDPVTGLASNPTTGNWWGPSVRINNEPVQVASNGSLILVRDKKNLVYAMDVTPETHAWTAVVTPIVTLQIPNRTAPSATFNGSNYFVSWVAGRVLYGTRIHPDTGAYLDSPPLHLSVLDNTEGGTVLGGVSTLGSDFVAVWLTNDCAYLHSRLIHADGTMSDETRTKLSSGYFTRDCGRLRVTGNGQMVLGAWWQSNSYYTPGGIRALRVNASGSHVPADTTGLPVIEVASYQKSTLVDIVADETPTPDRRTFGICTASDTLLVVYRVRSQTGAVVTPVFSDATSAPGVMASDGTLMLAVSKDAVPSYGTSAGVDALLIDPVTGVRTTTSSVVIDPGANALVPTLAWFDGYSYLVMTKSATSPSALRLRRLTTGLSLWDAPAAKDGIVFESEWLYNGQQAMAVAANGHGRSLVAYDLPDPLWHGTAIKTRFVDDDGLPSVGSGGAAGAGGGVSTGGVSTGGVSTGGVSTGGVSTGGVSTGGVSTGGVSTGGVSTGGVSTGGVSTGGVSTGGVSTGGVSTGGVSTGGVSTGGVSTGGFSTGGVATTGGATSGGSTASAGMTGQTNGGTAAVNGGAGVGTDVSGGAGATLSGGATSSAGATNGSSGNASGGGTSEGRVTSIGGSASVGTATEAQNGGSSGTSSGAAGTTNQQGLAGGANASNAGQSVGLGSTYGAAGVTFAAGSPANGAGGPGDVSASGASGKGTLVSAAGRAAASPGTSNAADESDRGCGCRLTDNRQRNGAAEVILGLLGLVMIRRRLTGSVNGPPSNRRA